MFMFSIVHDYYLSSSENICSTKLLPLLHSLCRRIFASIPSTLFTVIRLYRFFAFVFSFLKRTKARVAMKSTYSPILCCCCCWYILSFIFSAYFWLINFPREFSLKSIATLVNVLCWFIFNRNGKTLFHFWEICSSKTEEEQVFMFSQNSVKALTHLEFVNRCKYAGT